MTKLIHIYMKKLTATILLEQKELTNIGGICGIIMTEQREVTNKSKKIRFLDRFHFEFILVNFSDSNQRL